MATPGWKRNLILPHRRSAAALFALLGLVTETPVLATDDHQHGPNEYLRVNNGLAPNPRFSITTHGEGEIGSDHFHVYLMAEPGQRKIGSLEEIRRILDTAPDAFDAYWSADSRHVAITHRESRHVLGFALYRIEHGRAYLARGPSLLDAVANSHGVELTNRQTWDWRAKRTGLRWLSSTRFVLEEFDAFNVANRAIAQGLPGYVTTEKEPRMDGYGTMGNTISFSARSTCDLTANDQHRVLRPAPGPAY